MKRAHLDLSSMTVEDLFRAKAARRKRLANLPFEEKIRIVRKLQELSRSLTPSRAPNGRNIAAGKDDPRIKTK